MNLIFTTQKIKLIFIFIYFIYPSYILGLISSDNNQIFFYGAFCSDLNDQSYAESDLMKGINEELKKKNFYLKITDLKNENNSEKLAYVVFFNFEPKNSFKNLFQKFPLSKRILFAWEPPTVMNNLYRSETFSSFQKIYTWNDDLVDNLKFFKFYYPSLIPYKENLPSFTERKLLTQISRNKNSKHPKELYFERMSVINFFEKKPLGEFEFYGNYWEAFKFRNYKGVCLNKLETLKNYRFSICYENMRDIKGYITEKIFDCFAVGTIPIYWGASNVTDYIPKECFIDRRDFKNFNEVYNYIKTIDETSYNNYIYNIQRFLKSDKAKVFTIETFNKIFLEAVTENK